MKKTDKLNLDIIDKIIGKERNQPTEYVTLLDYETEQEGKRYSKDGRYYVNIKTTKGDVIPARWSPYAEKWEHYRNTAIFQYREYKIKQVVKARKNPKTRYFMEVIKAKGGPNDGEIYYIKYRGTRGGQITTNKITGETRKLKGRDAIIHHLMRKYEFSEYEILSDKVTGEDVRVLRLAESYYAKTA